jgi:hypothetical protein
VKRVDLKIKSFIIKGALLFIPIIVIMGFSYFVISYSGEFTTVNEVIDKQKNSEIILYGLAYSDPTPYYKLKSVIDRNPRIIALGTSRVMQFRSEFFLANTDFYNAGGGVRRVENLNLFLDNIPSGKEPEIIILGLDQNFFNPNWKDFLEENNKLYTFSKRIDIFSNSWRKIYFDYYNGKFSINKILEKENGSIGLNAIMNNRGFRNDGSYEYGNLINEFNSDNNSKLKGYFSLIKNEGSRFEYSNKISDNSLYELDRFLRRCKERNIYVIGFLPPYAHEIYLEIERMKIEYEYFFELEPTLNPIFKKYGYNIYNFSDLNSTGADACEVIDGTHASDKAYLRLFILLAENEEALKNETNISRLKFELNNSNSCYSVFTHNH